MDIWSLTGSWKSAFCRPGRRPWWGQYEGRTWTCVVPRACVVQDHAYRWLLSSEAILWLRIDNFCQLVKVDQDELCKDFAEKSSEGRCYCSLRSHLNRVFYVEGEDRGVSYIPQYFTSLPALARHLMQGEEESSIAIPLWDWETSRWLGSFLKPSPSIALLSSSRWGNSVPSGEEVGVGFHPSL